MKRNDAAVPRFLIKKTIGTIWSATPSYVVDIVDGTLERSRTEIVERLASVVPIVPATVPPIVPGISY